MSRTRSNRLTLAPLAAAALLFWPGGDAAAQEEAAARRGAVLSSEISVSRGNAELDLGLADGRDLEFAVRDGKAWVEGQEIGAAARGSELDRSWRELLNRAMDTPADRLGTLLYDWSAPSGEVGARLDQALEDAIGSVPAEAADAAAGPELAADAELDARLEELSEELDELRAERADLREELEDARRALAGVRRESRDDGGLLMRPIRHVWHQVGHIFEWFAMYALIVALGFGAVFFGRRYLEGVADTARRAPLQSGLVGMAAAFLVVPVFILGTLALVVSIVGIPALLAWLPLFPVAVVLATAFGYLAVAHAAGEALAERRLQGGDWFTRANSYYYVLTGAGLLVALFILRYVIAMIGIPVIPGMLAFLGGFVTWAALSVGLGAVLLSRGGTRPYAGAGAPAGNGAGEYGDVFEEEHHV